ncbi:MAG: prolipoprotein diacylglyceryl transferase [Hyphomicrobiaceae bacterium]
MLPSKGNNTIVETYFTHRIDPVLFRIGEIETYWYGLGYAVGFLGLHLWMMVRRRNLGWSAKEVYGFSILFAVCVLLGGRLFSVFFYHWEYFAPRPMEIIAIWRGGLTSHGLLIGGVTACAIASFWLRQPLARLLDEVAIPAAFFLALGRLGNFINGQIVGSVTQMPWGVIFPGFDEPRHPVTLYEAIKNLLLVPILILVARRYGMGRGLVAAHFILWYGFLRIIADLYRDYAGTYWGIGKGQFYNFGMAFAGLVLVLVLKQRPGVSAGPKVTYPEPSFMALLPRRLLFALVLCVCLLARSGWNQDVIKSIRSSEEIKSKTIGTIELVFQS